MTLYEYLKQHRLTTYDFAALIKTSQAAVQRYAKGERIPDEKIMPRIYAKTGGKVTANDFYGLPPKGTRQ
jgi:transcriptional regulator with XRE-family HTH domain